MAQTIEKKRKKPIKVKSKPKVKAKRKPTTRQLLAFNGMVENGGSLASNLRKVGYSEAVARNPDKVTDSDGWQSLMEEYLPPELIARKHREGLDATKKEEIIDIDEKGRPRKIVIDAPDFAVRHKYVDSAYKIMGKYKEEKDPTGGNNTFNFTNVYNQAQEMKARDKNKDIVADPVEVENSPEKILQEMKKKIGL